MQPHRTDHGRNLTDAEQLWTLPPDHSRSQQSHHLHGRRNHNPPQSEQSRPTKHQQTCQHHSTKQQYSDRTRRTKSQRTTRTSHSILQRNSTADQYKRPVKLRINQPAQSSHNSLNHHYHRILKSIHRNTMSGTKYQLKQDPSTSTKPQTKANYQHNRLTSANNTLSRTNLSNSTRMNTTESLPRKRTRTDTRHELKHSANQYQ